MAPREPKDRPEKAEDPAAASFAGSSTNSPYVAGPGPGFDSSIPPPPPPQAGEEPELSAFALGWEESQVHDWLLNAGDLAHAGFGIGESDWAMTKADLERIAPPMTRILNRFEPSRAIAAYSDPAAVAMGFGMYGWRSALERTAVLRARERAKDLGVAPAPAGPEGPPGEEPYISAADRLRATRPPEAP